MGYPSNKIVALYIDVLVLRLLLSRSNMVPIRKNNNNNRMHIIETVVTVEIFFRFRKYSKYARWHFLKPLFSIFSQCFSNRSSYLRYVCFILMAIKIYNFFIIWDKLYILRFSKFQWWAMKTAPSCRNPFFDT